MAISDRPESAGAVPDAVREAFERRFARRPEVLVRAPGRVNLLGAHVDHSEGWVLPATIDRAVWVAAAAADRGRLRVHALDFDESATVSYDELPGEVVPRRATSWIDYPAGVAWALRRAGQDPCGLDAVFAGDVPVGAGLSSSAAVEMGFLLAWEASDGFELDGRDKARLGRRVENEYLHVSSGVMDQFACVHGRPGRAILLDCRDLSHELLPVPDDVAVLVADSGIRRRLGEVGFNDRGGEVRRAIEVLRSPLPRLAALRDLALDDYELWSHLLPVELRRRVRHTVEECRRVLAGAEALRRGDLDAFGHLMRLSHLSSRDLYEVSLPELDELAAAAWRVPGCCGARLAGGGFGGCVTVLAKAAAREAIRHEMTASFERRFGRSPSILTCRIGDGATVVSSSRVE